MNDSERVKYQAIKEFLRREVPTEIQAVLDRGGVNDRDMDWLQQEENDDPKDDRPFNVLMRADEYLLYPDTTEKQTRGLLVFRKTIAIMAFVGCGVRLFGLRFSIQSEGFVDED